MYVSKHLVSLLVITLWMITDNSTFAAPVIPGTGVKLAKVGDDFEDPNWKFYPKLPKSSQELDEETRLPAGRSRNGRWFEGVKRGCPDFVQRVPTPPGGLPTKRSLRQTSRPCRNRSSAWSRGSPSANATWPRL